MLKITAMHPEFLFITISPTDLIVLCLQLHNPLVSWSGNKILRWSSYNYKLLPSTLNAITSIKKSPEKDPTVQTPSCYAQFNKVFSPKPNGPIIFTDILNHIYILPKTNP